MPDDQRADGRTGSDRGDPGVGKTEVGACHRLDPNLANLGHRGPRRPEGGGPKGGGPKAAAKRCRP